MAEKPTARAVEVPLAPYNAKRNFKVTSEPAGVPAKRAARKAKALSFVIQKHWASRLHYDFRLELGGVMLSWELPRHRGGSECPIKREARSGRDDP